MQPDLYAQWRARARGPVLREDAATTPPERLLQAIWWHQRLRREELNTTDGRPLRVLHPGFWNRAAGPDFQRAAVQFGDEPPRFGDIEVDLEPAGWRAHGHDRNASFRGVILHVVWRQARGATSALPTLELARVLDAPLERLDDWLGGEASGGFPEGLRGRCAAPLRELGGEVVRELLEQAAHVRLRGKAGAFTARAQAAGWEQALWEGVFGSLGYQHNIWPFRRLAELLPALGLGRAKSSPAAWQARLLGAAGLLPGELPRGAAGAEYLRSLWDHWWRERDPLAALVLPRALWRLQGLRPANHPARRLALAAHWLATGDLPARVERWFEGVAETARPADSFLHEFAVERDDFWSWHLAWSSARSAKPQALLGAPRAGDLAVNVVLPWLHARATAGHRRETAACVEQLYFAWPAGEDNAVLKLARQRLLGARPAHRLETAAAQQGLLQIVRDFCGASNSLCDGCRFPDLVRQAAGGVPE